MTNLAQQMNVLYSENKRVDHLVLKPYKLPTTPPLPTPPPTHYPPLHHRPANNSSTAQPTASLHITPPQCCPPLAHQSHHRSTTVLPGLTCKPAYWPPLSLVGIMSSSRAIWAGQVRQQQTNWLFWRLFEYPRSIIP